jgi:signal transduction histidine kinase
MTSVFAKSHDYVLERAYFEDTSSALNFDQIQNKTFTPYDGLFSKGYSKSAFWVRLKIAANTQPDLKEFVLRMQPTYLDEIQLFDPAHPSDKPRVTGDRYAFEDSEYQSLTINFIVPADTSPRYIWLRIKTTSTYMMQVRALDIKGAKYSDQVYETFSIVVMSALIIFLIWSAIHWLMFRERVVGVFFIRQLVAILFFASYVGYFRVLLSDQLSPAFLDRTLSLLVILSSATSIWFHIEFFRDYQLNRWLKLCFTWLLILFPIELTIMWAGYLSKALELNMAVVLIVPIFMLGVALFGIRWDQLKDEVNVLPRPALIFFHTLYVVIVVLVAVPSLGISKATELAPHSVLVHGVVTGLALLMMLMYRSKRIQQKSLVEVAIAHQEALVEKKQREEQGHFLEMLTHEFKTSLAVLRMAIGTAKIGSKEAAYAEQAIQGMNDVIERCGQVQALADQKIALEISECHLNGLLNEVIERSREPSRVALDCDQHLMIKSDLKLLKVIFSNLIDNAIKYGAAKSQVEVSAKLSNGQVSIMVSNQVHKARMPDASLVFTKYYRASWAHEQVGSGLGLYLTSQLANMLGGELRYLHQDQQVSFELCLKQSA